MKVPDINSDEFIYTNQKAVYSDVKDKIVGTNKTLLLLTKLIYETCVLHINLYQYIGNTYCYYVFKRRTIFYLNSSFYTLVFDFMFSFSCDSFSRYCIPKTHAQILKNTLLHLCFFKFVFLINF